MLGCEKVLEFLKENGPSTDEEIAKGTKMNPSSARTRRMELERTGEVMAVDRGVTSSGRKTWVWDLASKYK